MKLAQSFCLSFVFALMSVPVVAGCSSDSAESPAEPQSVLGEEVGAESAGGKSDVRVAICGGFVGLRCRGSLKCVDDPSDDCDPAKGGRDCSGVCANVKKAKHCGGIAGLSCAAGQSCVDDPNDACNPAKGGRDCLGICVTGSVPAKGGESTKVSCGGIANLPCAAGGVCVDDPSDGCDPAKGGRDCSGICIEKKLCGGFAGLACADGTHCVDDASDSCDPENGGRDCSGFCVPDGK